MLRSTFLLFITAVAAQTATQTSASAASSSHAAATSGVTAVSDCHNHGTVQYCMAGTTEFEVLATATGTQALPASYTGCHNHGSELYCFSPSGGEVQFALEGSETHSEDDHDHSSDSTSATADATQAAASATGTSTSGAGENCHFHAGVEHCEGHGAEAGEVSCERVDRDYNKGLRIGLIFVMLVTSCIGVFGPMILTSWFRFNPEGAILVIIRQFGTGVIISTAFVHLFTHASLNFSNPCLGNLEYEATTAAILMAGLFLSFIVEYVAHRFVHARQVTTQHTTVEADKETQTSTPDGSTTSVVVTEHQKQKADALNALVLESGIIFHSLLIGLTLVVAGDSVFGTLFAVIVFHQMFEGIALGTLIAGLKGTSGLVKIAMASAFAIVTPIGMAIGVGVLEHFNGSDKSTLIAIGTLNALSAGILVWVGVVEMWAKDWMHGPLAHSGIVKTSLALFSLVLGMAIMSLLGKWA